MTTILAVTVVCLGAMNATIANASPFSGITWSFWWQDELPPPQQIPTDIMRGAAHFTAVPQQHPPSQIGPQNNLPITTQVYYSCYAMDSQQVSSSPSQISLSAISCVSVMVFAFYIQVLMWSFHTNGGSTIRFASPQPFQAYPWGVYMPLGFGSWPMSGMYQVAATLTA